jgi:NADH-quinone oxidoreductase subunit H
MQILESLGRFASDPFTAIGDALKGLLSGVLAPSAIDIILMVLGALVLFIVPLSLAAGMTWLERKLVARIQDRLGPNMAGPKGLLLPIADAIKLFTKELTTPAEADAPVYNLAPIIVTVFAVLTFIVVPWGPNIIGTNLNIGAFYIVAISSAATIAILMAGWGSRNKFSLLGAFRTVAQLIGYEIPMLLNIIPIVMITGSMSLIDIVERQWSGGVPFLLMFPLSALCFLISGLAETGRSPFDLLEAESEIVAGFHVEYSGMKFGLIMIGEYINAIAIAALFSTLFLGGYAGPQITLGDAGPIYIIPPYLMLLLKTIFMMAIFMWLRGTLPRVRIDQLLNMNWKFLVPLSVVHIVMVMILNKIVGTPEFPGLITVAPMVQAAINGVLSLLMLLGALALVGGKAKEMRAAKNAQAKALAMANTRIVAAGK